MFMGVIETALIGRLGAAELAGTGVARSVFWLVTIFGFGMLSAVDILASHALGAKQTKALGEIFAHGFSIAVWLSIILTSAFLLIMPALHWFNYDPKILLHAQTYLIPVAFGLPFMLVFSFMQRYWQSQNLSRPVVLIVIGANIITFVLNEILIFGRFGISPMGVFGAGIAMTTARVFMCVTLLLITIKKFRNAQVPMNFRLSRLLKVDTNYARKFLRYGLPAGLQLACEVGLFSIIMILAAKLTPAEAAAHQIVLIICSFTYMVPLGLANAAAFRVGHFVGESNFRMAKISGFVAIGIGVVFMSISASTLFAFPSAVLSLFTSDANVLAFATRILIFAAFFQIIDAIQGCTIGALRGAGNTAFASVVSLIGFYPIGLVLGFTLCFYAGLRLEGLWIGLFTGLLFIAVAVLYYWHTITPVAVFVQEQPRVNPVMSEQ